MVSTAAVARARQGAARHAVPSSAAAARAGAARPPPGPLPCQPPRPLCTEAPVVPQAAPAVPPGPAGRLRTAHTWMCLPGSRRWRPARGAAGRGEARSREGGWGAGYLPGLLAEATAAAASLGWEARSWPCRGKSAPQPGRPGSPHHHAAAAEPATPGTPARGPRQAPAHLRQVGLEVFVAVQRRLRLVDVEQPARGLQRTHARRRLGRCGVGRADGQPVLGRAGDSAVGRTASSSLLRAAACCEQQLAARPNQTSRPLPTQSSSAPAAAG